MNIKFRILFGEIRIGCIYGHRVAIETRIKLSARHVVSHIFACSLWDEIVQMATFTSSFLRF